MNNPLVYNDPDGEFIIPAMIFSAIINTYIQDKHGKINNFGDFILSMGIGALSGAIGAGVGAGVNTVLAGGCFSAGFIGSSTVNNISTGFTSGFVTGAAGGGTSGFLTGFCNAAMEPGSKLGDMLMAGFDYGCKGAFTGGVMGGIAGGIDALKHDRNFLTGADKQDMVFKINADGRSSLISGHNIDRPNISQFVKDYYKTPLDNHPNVLISSNDQVKIKLPSNITRANAVEAFNNKGILMNVENLNLGRKFITFNIPYGKPDYLILSGWRYHSTPVRSLRHLFYPRSGSINLF